MLALTPDSVSVSSSWSRRAPTESALKKRFNLKGLPRKSKDNYDHVSI